MELTKPKTYNELMIYSRCLQLKKWVPGMDDALLQKVYDFLCQSKSHSVYVAEGSMMFKEQDQVQQSIPVAVDMLIKSVALSAVRMDVSYPYSGGSGGDGDGGSSGNNNNNNNNNNNG